jgi:plasmid stabilization system protein ParE
MTRLVVTADAEADINDVLDYLRKEAGARVAISYGRKFATIIERLVESPGIGAPRPTLGPDVRIGIVPPYVLIYAFTAADDTLTLLRVVHGKRNITRRLIRGS